MHFPIYLDNSSTTPVDPRVAEKMMECLTREGNFGNPASRSHMPGWKAEEAVETARRHVADLINCDPREIVWTSGATEADNLAIKGAAHFYNKKGKHVITSKIEHKAVLDSCRQLEREGYEVTYLDPSESGIISPESVASAIRPDTTLVSLMHVNNEIGVINDIEAIGKITREQKVIFHVDAAQSVGKVNIDLEKMQVDLLSLTTHKVYGMRSGTLPTHQIVGMGEAFRIAKEEMAEENSRILALRNRLLEGLSDIEEVYVNGDIDYRVAGNLNISFNFVEGESLIMALRDLAISSGSACTSASLEPSYVLRALGLNDELAHSSLRIMIGRFTSEEEVDYTIEKIHAAVAKLRELSPLWDMYKDGVDLDQVQWAAH